MIVHAQAWYHLYFIKCIIVDMNTTIPNEIRFAQYKTVNGVQIPFHIQHMLNGLVVLDITVTSATLNTGLLDSQLTLQ